MNKKTKMGLKVTENQLANFPKAGLYPHPD